MGGARPTGERGAVSARDRLLAGAVAYVAEHGFREVSLRELAGELGTSHRMLLYHFGSKETLYVEIIRAFEAVQRDAVSELVANASGTPQQLMRRIWRQLSAPENDAQIRLFFEVCAAALRGGTEARSALEHIVSDWLTPLEELERARGTATARTRANLRLGVAVMRGLLLDLVASGDRRAVDAAFERFLAGFDPD